MTYIFHNFSEFKYLDHLWREILEISNHKYINCDGIRIIHLQRANKSASKLYNSFVVLLAIWKKISCNLPRLRSVFFENFITWAGDTHINFSRIKTLVFCFDLFCLLKQTRTLTYKDWSFNWNNILYWKFARIWNVFMHDINASWKMNKIVKYIYRLWMNIFHRDTLMDVPLILGKDVRTFFQFRFVLNKNMQIR